MRLLVIRHGETASNAARILQTPDIPLSDRGRKQAGFLARRLAGEAIERIVSSDYVRAVETAEAVASTTGAPLQFEPLLRERNFGDWRGRPYAELNFDPHALDSFPPNGESWEVFHDRVGRAMDAIVRIGRKTEGTLAVVTHGLVCRGLTNRHFAADHPDYEDPWANTSVSEFEGPPWRVHRVNCTVHLGGEVDTSGGAA